MSNHYKSNDTWTQVVKDLGTWSSLPAVSENTISMVVGGNEMLKVAPDGFYVRGIRVPADEKEADKVYKAFKQFLVWAELHRT
jgi:hypothetical protein